MATIAIIKFVLILQKIILIDMVLILKLFFPLFLNIMYFPKIFAVFFFHFISYLMYLAIKSGVSTKIRMQLFYFILFI